MWVVGSDDTDFTSLVNDKANEIQALSKTQKVPGMGPDEVRQELMQTLWKAFNTYDGSSGTTIGQWWWVIWTRHKADLIQTFFAKKNWNTGHDEQILEEIGDTLEPLVLMADLCPGTEVIDRSIWVMLSLGFDGREIRSLLGISVRRFYAVIDSWRTEEVRAILLHT